VLACRYSFVCSLRNDLMARTHLAIAVAAVSLLLFSCRGASTSDHKLLVYTPHGQDLLSDFVARYKQVHPETEIQFLDMGAREVFERVRAERNRPQADLWWGAAHTTFQQAAEENLLAPYRPSWAEKVPAASRDVQDRWYGTYETPEVIVYNSEAVTEAEAPKDWDDVLDARWRDKILIRNPNPSDSMRAIFGAMIWRFYKDSGSPEKGYEWLRRLDANVHEYTADGTLMVQKLARREGLISLWDMPPAVLRLLRTRSPSFAAPHTKQKRGAFTNSLPRRKAWSMPRKTIIEFPCAPISIANYCQAG
jgi:spermidine/putrescine-binding protein